ncbi:MAG: amidohydrolase family protein [Alphaproteobacteria bacterium]|nr:amidohydrolase family protein [Alphaproteobacteria bacterium]
MTARLLAGARLVLPGASPRAELPLGALLVEAGRIAAIATAPEEIQALRGRANEVDDLSGLTLMPGLINAHYHSYGNAARGTENALPLEPWALYTVAYGRALGPEAIRLSILLGAAEMLRAGITGAIDHFAHVGLTEEALAAHRQTGMRIGFAPFLHDLYDHDVLGVALPAEIKRRIEGPPRPGPDAIAGRIRDLHSGWQGREGRIAILLGPNAPFRCSDAMLASWRDLARTLDAPSHTHLLETRLQAEAGAKRWGEGRTLGALDRLGLVDARLSCAHAIWLAPAERELMARRGAVAVHNPSSNLMLGSGLMDLADYLARGVTVALGSDTANTGGRHDLFGIMRLAMMLPRPGQADPARWIDAAAAFRLASEGGAAALGMKDELGRIEEGARADLVAIDLEHAASAALVPNLAALVQHASPALVRATMVEGCWVYRQGKVLAFDEVTALARFRDLRAEIAERARPELEAADAAREAFLRLYAAGAPAPSPSGDRART